MLKVFLVEDDVTIRNGIKNSIGWEDKGCVLCGEAGDGESAFSSIQKVMPDIVITDIEMPVMNGLELSRLIKKEFPQVRIIILSEHKEFEYAKEAIDIGVEKYLLKPIDEQVLFDELEKIGEMVRREKETKEEQKSEEIRTFDVGHIDKKKIDNFLRSGDKGDINRFVEEYFYNIGMEGMASYIFRQYITMDIYFTVIAFVEELGKPTDILKEMFNNASKVNKIIVNMDETKKFVIFLFEKVITWRDEIAIKKYSALIEMAKEYIQENYNKEGLSLNAVASNVNISPSHLSAVFGQETGQTFVKYLTDIRMTKAKELLKCTNMKSSAISAAVGYKDPHYFSFLFKKTQKCTPMQYRNNIT